MPTGSSEFQRTSPSSGRLPGRLFEVRTVGKWILINSNQFFNRQFPTSNLQFQFRTWNRFEIYSLFAFSNQASWTREKISLWEWIPSFWTRIRAWDSILTWNLNIEVQYFQYVELNLRTPVQLHESGDARTSKWLQSLKLEIQRIIRFKRFVRAQWNLGTPQQRSGGNQVTGINSRFSN